MPRSSPLPRTPRLPLVVLFCAVAALALTAPAAEAQPFVSWADFPGAPTHSYVNIPHHPALNPTGAFTFEAWVKIANNVTGEDCRTIAGKNFLQAWWFGQCNVSGQPTLRSYLKGGASARNGGIIPRNVWTHVAVTFDGANRRHYINGELAATFAESGPLSTSTANVRIASDVSWQFSPNGEIDEVRLWNVARSTSQIRSTINVALTTPQPGLVSVWALNGNTGDAVGPHDGSPVGTIFAANFPAVANCLGFADANTLCLNNRFLVNTFWRTSPAAQPVDGQAGVAVNTTNSGIFWFFSPDNWEVMVKALNGCGLNDRFWIFSAATTNVFYRMEVLDVAGARQKIYFNYPGPPAPAVTDTSAFATCP
jgi:hypothetical protein